MIDHDNNTLNHHLSHAYSSFFTSNFDEAAILIADGVGSLIDSESDIRETTTYGMGRDNHIEILDKVTGFRTGEKISDDTHRIWHNSLGELYGIITKIIGFHFLQSGKTMGLVPYGDDRFVEQVIKHIKFLPSGQFEIHATGKSGLIETLKDLKNTQENTDEFTKNACIAYAGQFCLERVLEHCLDYLWEQTKCENLCFIGGIALNSVFNGKLRYLSNFKNIHILFAPGDNGAAIGAAIWGVRDSFSTSNRRFSIPPYLGKEYTEKDIRLALESSNLSYRAIPNMNHYIAAKLSSNAVVGWFQGRSEFGPRALGNRSILANPQSNRMKDHVNKIKGREWFRPLAPVVPQNETYKYFEADFEIPWMQYVLSVKPEFIDTLPSCVHVDNTARVQSVTMEENNKLYDLLIEFGNLTGHPVLINTSFNIQGEPIVETPQQAINSFLKSELDVLVLHDYVVEKY